MTRRCERPYARNAWLAASLLLGSCASSPSAYEVPAPPANAPLAAEVNPFIGTAGGASFGDGQTFPGAVVPWGMASPSPHTTLTTPVDAANGLFVNSRDAFRPPLGQL